MLNITAEIYLEKISLATEQIYLTYTKLWLEPEKYDDWQKQKFNEEFFSKKSLINQYLFYMKGYHQDGGIIMYAKKLKNYPTDMIEKVFKQEDIAIMEKFYLENNVKNEKPASKIKI